MHTYLKEGLAKILVYPNPFDTAAQFTQSAYPTKEHDTHIRYEMRSKEARVNIYVVSLLSLYFKVPYNTLLILA